MNNFPILSRFFYVARGGWEEQHGVDDDGDCDMRCVEFDCFLFQDDVCVCRGSVRGYGKFLDIKNYNIFQFSSYWTELK